MTAIVKQKWPVHSFFTPEGEIPESFPTICLIDPSYIRLKACNINYVFTLHWEDKQ